MGTPCLSDRNPSTSARLCDYAFSAVLVAVAGSVDRQAEELLRQKAGDPVAAAAGAYALLYLGELDRLHDWTMNLADWFPWLPDGTVIAAEHRAREGDHDRARQLLRELDYVDGALVPWLSAGLFYTCDRLRTYCEAPRRGAARARTHPEPGRFARPAGREGDDGVATLGVHLRLRSQQPWTAGATGMGGADSGLKAAVDYANQNFP